MKALFTLNRFFWKYRYRMLLGLVFIVLTNIFAVYSPTLIEEGIGVLGEAQKTYFDAIDFTEDGTN